MASLLKELAEERVILVDKPQSQFPFPLKGIVRFINKDGETLGILLDREILEEIEEDIESLNPKFLAALKASRKSGRVSGEEIKKRMGQ